MHCLELQTTTNEKKPVAPQSYSVQDSRVPIPEIINAALASVCRLTTDNNRIRKKAGESSHLNADYFMFDPQIQRIHNNVMILRSVLLVLLLKN